MDSLPTEPSGSQTVRESIVVIHTAQPPRERGGWQMKDIQSQSFIGV